jgi:hypothetical protein
MTNSMERTLRQLAAEQECQAEVRARAVVPSDIKIHPVARNWSPLVTAGLLALTVLTAVTGLITLLATAR